MSGNLGSDPLFLGLTRPTMIFGVSVKYAAVNMLVSMLWFVNKVSIYIIFGAILFHLIGYVVCFKEPLFVEIILNYLNKCSNCPNKSYYGANSYSV